MTTLMIKTKDDKIYKGKQPMHFMLAEKYKIKFDDIIAVGFITHNREVWDNRKPH